MKLIFSPEALADIGQIRQYISVNLKNKSAAKRVVNMIAHSCEQLESQPHLGMSLEARTGYHSDLRYLLCESWLAFYRIQGDTVRIVRVIDGRTDYVRILFGN